MPLYPYQPSGNQPVVQARRTTSFTLGASFADITLDATDVSSNTAIIEHDGTNTQRVNIKVDGNYLICYDATAPAGSGLTTSLQVKKNNTTVLAGSGRSSKISSTDEPSITGAFVASLVAGDYIVLQASADSGTPALAAGVVFAVVCLKGEKGEKGDASATDVDAIHVNVANEITGITEKTSLASDDVLVLEDSAASFVKKKIKAGNLPSGAAPSDTAPVNVTKAAASAGVAATVSRQDHKHDVTTAAPSALAVGNTQSEGSATSLARSDHQHAVTGGTPVSVGTANAAGTGADFARNDHVHSGLTRGAGDFSTFTAKATPVPNDVLLIEDSESAGAKKSATLGAAVGSFLAQNSAVATGTITTTSTTDVLATSMTLTPAAGTYLVMFGGTFQNSNSGSSTYADIWYNGAKINGSERSQRNQSGNNRPVPFQCVAIVTVDGVNAIEGRWRVSSNTGSMYERNLVVVRVA